eukprot:450669-Prymnesium_polylepis.1
MATLGRDGMTLSEQGPSLEDVDEELLEALIARMSLKWHVTARVRARAALSQEKVGQMFQINWKNMRPATGVVATTVSKVMPRRVSSMMFLKNDTRVRRLRRRRCTRWRARSTPLAKPARSVWRAAAAHREVGRRGTRQFPRVGPR